jgi:hypothetical protein
MIYTYIYDIYDIWMKIWFLMVPHGFLEAWSTEKPISMLWDHPRMRPQARKQVFDGAQLACFRRTLWYFVIGAILHRSRLGYKW